MGNLIKNLQMSFHFNKLTLYKLVVNFNFFLLRYTIWIPLYPIGFICEGVIALRNIPYFEETEQFSVLLPNRLTFT